MGPISDDQLRVCPPFWATQADLFGPVQVFVPGFTKNTRNRKVLEAKCWVMVFVCPVTRLTNIQVIEKSDNSGMVDGLTRLSCEVGVPKFVVLDEDSALVKAMQDVEVDLIDTQLQMHTEYGIEWQQSLDCDTREQTTVRQSLQEERYRSSGYSCRTGTLK